MPANTVETEMDQRYRLRLRSNGLKDSDPVPSLSGEDTDFGTWDIIEKRWVKRNEAGEWVPE